MELLHHLVLKKRFAKISKLLKKSSRWFNDKAGLLIALGVFIFCVGAVHYHQVRILSFTKPPVTAQTAEVGELPVEITIPSINIDQPVQVGTIKDGVWLISEKSATFLDSSARPGTGGNIVIYGHNKKAIFGNLPYLSIGQKIFIKTTSGRIYTYIAYEKDFVSPGRVDLVSPTNKEELTIYTCWGIFDSERVVIKARVI